jgi:hypothetical protein
LSLGHFFSIANEIIIKTTIKSTATTAIAARTSKGAVTDALLRSQIMRVSLAVPIVFTHSLAFKLIQSVFCSDCLQRSTFDCSAFSTQFHPRFIKLSDRLRLKLFGVASPATVTATGSSKSIESFTLIAATRS